jgi:phosphoribosylformylglycinamidine synthase
MGLVVKERDIEIIRKIANRERCPMYVVGEITGDHRLVFEDSKNNCTPINLDLGDFFGNPPKTIINDTTIQEQLFPLTYSEQKLQEYLENVLHLEAVACKDWLTNKVDRSVTGKVAKQQTAGSLQLPLNNMGVAALDFQGIKGMATSLGHAPVSGLIDSAKASILSIAEALTNIVWAPIDGGLKGISLSANWMWPSKNKGEDARLYQAVEAASNFAIQLGINIPTGKDSLSMTQKYDNGQVVYSPGTVIISASAEVTDIRKVVSPVLKYDNQTVIVYIDFAKDAFHLGGSSFAQSLNEIGNECPTVSDATYFANTFETLQTLISNEKIISGHDISSGGLITTLLEMTFAELELGMEINLDSIPESDIIRILFSEKPGVVIQIKDEKSIFELLNEKQVHYHIIGHPIEENRLQIKKNDAIYNLDINSFRDIWFKSSYLLDRKQCGAGFAKERFDNYKKQPLDFIFNTKFNGKATDYGINLKRRESTGIKAAIIREKGVNGDREMAYSLYCAGFDVKDVHITDLINGRETLNDIKFVVFVGGFSNSDVLGSAKGWAGSFLFNKLAKKALDDFYARPDTMSLGVCNGCQLMVELGLIYPEHEEQPKMLTNQSNKFESAFINLNIEKSNSIMLKSLQGSRLGIWIAHKEGRFKLPQKETTYQIAAKYTYKEYPANPNGSDFNTAAISSEDGRHLAMMPHLERSIFPWQWAKYPDNRKNDEVTPWIEAFVNARKWIEKNSNK